MRAPTEKEAQRIMEIIREVTWSKQPELFDWNGNKAEARALCLAISGYKPTKGDCFACETKVLDILREAVGLPPMTRPISEDRQRQRLAYCYVCPAYHKGTQSCGRLIKDALFPKEMTVDGVNFNPCGCFLPLKVTIKHATCPRGLW